MKPLVALSDGHEMTTSGKRTPPIAELGGRVILENEFNKAVALLIEENLIRCDIDVINVSSTDNDSLLDRVSRANAAHADIFVAIHYNAYDGKFDAYDPEGISVHIYGKGGEAEKLAKAVHKHLIQGTEQMDRGIIVSNFYVLRNTKMPAILTENGFMDNKREALLMLDPAFQREVAEEHARGICEYFGREYKQEEEGNSYMDKDKPANDIPDWAKDAMDWAVENNINDGIVQNETELQTVVMLYRYHKKFGNPST